MGHSELYNWPIKIIGFRFYLPKTTPRFYNRIDLKPEIIELICSVRIDFANQFGYFENLLTNFNERNKMNS